MIDTGRTNENETTTTKTIFANDLKFQKLANCESSDMDKVQKSARTKRMLQANGFYQLLTVNLMWSRPRG